MSFRDRVSEKNTAVGTVVASGDTWAGEWELCYAYSSLSVMASSTGAGQLFADFSMDGTTTDRAIELSVGSAAVSGIHSLIPVATHFRIRIVNQAGANNTIRVQTLKNPVARIAQPTSRVSQTLGDYSDVINTRSAIVAKNPGGVYNNVGTDEDGHLLVDISHPLSSFGEVRVAEPTPQVQIDAVHGLLEDVETFTATGGAATASGGNFTCTTGTLQGGYGVIRSRRTVRYRAGQGSLFRFTAGFDTGVAASLQAAGTFTAGSGFLVGYDGTAFGVMHRTGGRHEIRTFTISAAATGSETVDLTLNSVLYQVPVTSGTAAHNAFEIEQWLNANQSVWDAKQNDGAVVLFGSSVGALSGTYSVTSTGTLDGSFVQDGAGAANTETWTYQASFSEDPLDGTGNSGMTIDPSKGNVYEVGIQYLGYGQVDFKIENPSTGRFFHFHSWQFTNSRTTPTLSNPNLKVGWISASLGSTTDLTVYGASAMGGNDGKTVQTRRPKGHSMQRTGVAATLTSVFAIRVRNDFKGVVQLFEASPRMSSASPGGTKPVEVVFLLNPTFAGETNWFYQDQDESIIEIDETATTFSATGTEIGSFIVAGGTSGTFDFTKLDVGGVPATYLNRGEVLCIAARIIGGGGTTVDASLTWIEN